MLLLQDFHGFGMVGDAVIKQVSTGASGLLAALFAVATVCAAEAGDSEDTAAAAAAATESGYLELAMPEALQATSRSPSEIEFGGVEGAQASDDKFLYLNSRIGTLSDNLPDGTLSQLGHLSTRAASPGLGADHLGLLREVASGGQGAGAPSSLLTNETLQIGSFTPRFAGFEIGWGSQSREQLSEPGRGFGVAISSTYFVGGLGGTNALLADFLNREDRAYNVGLNVGFAGFSLGASYLKGDRETELGYQGYDFGVMYEGRAWATSLQFAEYTQRRDDLFLGAPEGDKIQSLEFGASYTFRLGITLAGRFQYYDYGSSFLSEDADDAQVFFLGTNLSF